MAKKGAKPRKRKPRVAGEVTLAPGNVKELTTGLRKLLALQAQRRRMANALRKLDDRIRDQRKFTRDILADPAGEQRGNVGELNEGRS